MKNLGKIAFFIFLIPHVIYASVTASVNSTSVTLGDTVTLSLNITGENAKRPTIYTLCDSDVTSTGTQTSIQIVNGAYQKRYTLNYQFMPQKSCKIQPIEFEIDGVLQKTKEIDITVKPMDAATSSMFKLKLSSNKKEVYAGESFEVVLHFTQKDGVDVVDSKFIAPQFKGFWMKNESEPTRYQENGLTVTKLTYTLAAQREGELKITPAQMKIASRDSSKASWGAWIPQIKWRSYFSNELGVKVKALPAGVDLVGDFTISAIADKNEINVNEAVNVKLLVKGSGNLEDIKTFKPYIDGVSVFDEKVVVDKTTLSQKMAFVADKDFVIPVFSLKYFNPKTKEIKTITTKEIKIKVNGSNVKSELNIKRQEDPMSKKEPLRTSLDVYWIVLAFIVGTVLGMLLMLVKPWSFSKKEKSISIKDPKNLLMKLLPYESNEDVKNIIDTLEQNIYSNKNIEIDKKVLKELLKKYDIK